MAASHYAQIVQKARDAFKSGRTRDVAFRKKQLVAMKQLLKENEQLISDALYADLNRSKHESTLMEFDTTIAEIQVALFNIDDWVKPKKVAKTMITILESTFIQYEPYGVALVIGAWNYPLHLVLVPVIGAIVAGNCCVMKPSEMSPSTEKVLAELIPKYLDQDCYPVVCGGPEKVTELLKERFDYVFYTGSSRVGQIVREAANKHLTPCTLEMGGKSPVYIADDCDFSMTAKRLLWGKVANAGQTCVAPDYVLCSKFAQSKLVEMAKVVLKNWYGDDPHASPDLGRIVNDKHFKRIVQLLQSSGEVAVGGSVAEADRYIEPTILVNVKASDPIMQEEIFGPVLPILNVQDVDEAISFINSREKPLSLYCFTKDEKIRNRMIAETSSGGFLGNDTMLHLSVESLPFGGVGFSGMGNYHGKYSFETFSHKKACLVRTFMGLSESIARSRYPPYTDCKTREARFILKKRKFLNPLPEHLAYVITFILGVITAYVFGLM